MGFVVLGLVLLVLLIGVWVLVLLVLVVIWVLVLLVLLVRMSMAHLSTIPSLPTRSLGLIKRTRGRKRWARTHRKTAVVGCG